MWYINLGEGWAINDKIEGWIGTRLFEQATSWKTLQEANNVLVTNYSTWKGEKIVCKIENRKIIEKHVT